MKWFSRSIVIMSGASWLGGSRLAAGYGSEHEDIVAVTEDGLSVAEDGDVAAVHRDAQGRMGRTVFRFHEVHRDLRAVRLGHRVEDVLDGAVLGQLEVQLPLPDQRLEQADGTDAHGDQARSSLSAA